MSHSKKLLQVLMVFVLAFSVLLPAQAKDAEAATPVTVYVNGNLLNTSQGAEIIDGSTMVPMRAIFEALGSQVGWYGDTRTITAFDPTTNNVLSLVVDKRGMFCADFTDWAPYEKNPTSPEAVNFVTEHMQTIPVAPLIKNSRTLVPARVISEALECQVGWDPDTYTVTINR